MVQIKVSSHEVNTPSGGQPYATYTLEVTTESGAQYSVQRRWNDLRKCEDALRKEYKLAGCKRVEAHSWRQFTGALSADFLEERAAQI